MTNRDRRSMPRPTRAVALIFALVLLRAPAFAATYYVSSAGNNAADGLTPATAFATLQFCANRAQPGDTFLVADGNYTGFNITRSGASGQPITFKALGNAARITAPNALTGRDGINVEGGSWVTLDGFVCSNHTRAGIRVVTADHCIVRNCDCEANGTWGIFTGFTDDLLLENNTCAYSQTQHGIYVSNSSDRAIIRGNSVHHNQDSGIQINADASQGGDGISTDCKILNNVLWENGAGGGAAINLDGAVRAHIANNLLYENHSTGIALFQIDAATASRDAVITHNTIVQAASSRWCVQATDGSTGATLRNNILVNQHTFRGAFDVDAASRAGIDSDYNLVTDRLSLDGGDSAITLAAWRSATGQDAHSKVVASIDSLFVARTSGDYHLAPASQALDAGVGLADADVALDGFGIARPQGSAPDIGAFERVIATGAPSANARFVNLSTRARATPADPVIAGFVITGTGDHTLLIRVVGPGLQPLGVPTALDDPQLTLFAGSSVVAQNDDWGSAASSAAIANAASAVSAFALADGSRDAALLATLPPGTYTVHGSAKAGSAGGVVLVELYDVAGGTASRLANVSTRAVGGTGDDTVIAGFVVAGNSTPVLLRSIGPTLANFGVTNTLRDPQLALFQGQSSIAANDQWSLAADAPATAAFATQLGAFALRSGSNDAVLRATLAAGAYTVQTAAAPLSGTTGAVLIEVYAP